MVINTILIYHNLNCLPIDKLLEGMNNNPTKSGLIMQIIYLCMVAYFEYPYDYNNHTDLEKQVENTTNEIIKKS